MGRWIFGGIIWIIACSYVVHNQASFLSKEMTRKGGFDQMEYIIKIQVLEAKEFKESSEQYAEEEIILSDP